MNMPVWKRLLFGIIAIALFFVTSELIFKVAGVKPLFVTEDPFVGFAGNIPLFIEEVQADGTIMLVTARNKLPAFNEQQFPKIKTGNSFRIFCMGGSTTYGHPFFDQTSFCGWLREFLSAADPKIKWEVINAGGVSYASYRVANLMNELLQYEPDLFVVYSGQNEFLEERTYHNIKEIPYWVMNLKVALSKTRTYTVMSRLLKPSEKDQPQQTTKRYIMSREENAILNNSIGPTSYTRNDILKDQIITHYKFNLRRMIAIARSKGSKIIFVTPASILKDMPPFKSENRAGISDEEKNAWSSLYEQGKKFQKTGHASQALLLFNKALRIDNQHADIQFRVGQVLFDLRRFDESKIAFQNAIDEDICPLRILSPMSKVLREIAAESNAPLIDFVKLTEDDCYLRFGHKIPGDEYFIDHIHPTIEGNRMLGLALLDQMTRQGIVTPGHLLNDETILAVTRKVEQSIDPNMKVLALRNLALTIDWTGKHDKARSILLNALPLEKNDQNKGLIFDTIAHLFFRRGKVDDAIDYWYKALPFWPDNKTIRSSLALLLQRNGRPKEALDQHYEILRIINARKQGIIPSDPDNDFLDPISTEDIISAHANIAAILSVQGQTKKAIFHYTEVLKLKPDQDSAHINIGTLLIKDGYIAEGVQHFTTALKINPNSSTAHYNMGMILEKQGKSEEASSHYSEALRIDPESAEAHNNFGVMLAKQGKIAEAVVHFSAVLNTNPDNIEAHYNLGMAFAIQGKKEESDFHFSEAKRINTGSSANIHENGIGLRKNTD